MLRSLRSIASPVPATTMETNREESKANIDSLNAQLQASKNEVTVLVAQHRHQSIMFAAEQKKQADQQRKSMENLERLQLLLVGVREQIKSTTRSVALTVDIANDDTTQPESGETTNISGTSTPYLLSSQKSMDEQDGGLGLVKEEGQDDSVMIRGRIKSMEAKLASIVEDISRATARQAAIARKVPIALEDGTEEHFYHAATGKKGSVPTSDGAMISACASLEENLLFQIRQLHQLFCFEDLPLSDANNQEDCGCYGFSPFSPRPGRNVPHGSTATTSTTITPEEHIRALETKLVFALESVVNAAECRLSDDADERCELIAHQERVTLSCADDAEQAKTTIQDLQEQLEKANGNIESLTAHISPLQQVGG